MWGRKLELCEIVKFCVIASLLAFYPGSEAPDGAQSAQARVLAWERSSQWGAKRPRCRSSGLKNRVSGIPIKPRNVGVVLSEIKVKKTTFYRPALAELSPDMKFNYIQTV